MLNNLDDSTSKGTFSIFVISLEKALPKFELGLLDSESKVLTITQ